MKTLVDTHLLLWAANDERKLSKKARKWLQDEENELFYSPVSLWEIVIKNGLGRSDFQVNTSQLRRGLQDNGYQELVVRSEHSIALQSLPPIHRDPFDRMLISQAAVEGLVLLTSDAVLAQYQGPVKVV
jgi:PIN domain nuclease of toxin-antitoxin system